MLETTNPWSSIPGDFWLFFLRSSVGLVLADRDFLRVRLLSNILNAPFKIYNGAGSCVPKFVCNVLSVMTETIFEGFLFFTSFAFNHSRAFMY